MIDEARRQAALEAMNILDTPADERVDRVTRLAQQMFGVPMVSVSLIDRDRQFRKSEIGLGGREAPRKDSFCDYTVRHDAALVVEDASAVELFADNPFVTGDPKLRFYAAQPLRAPGGEPVGTLCILDTAPRSFGEADQALLRDLASWVQLELARDQELGHAALVQHALRPAELPRVPGYTIAAASQAAGRLAGDMYDLVLRDGVLRFTLADAMGKGIGPAMAAVFTRASLATAPGRSVVEAIDEADVLLECLQGDASLFVTAVHADIDTASGAVELVDAGHGLTFVLRADGTFEQLRSTGLPLGMGAAIAEERVATRTVLAPGDMLICCSDGLLDILDEQDPFGQVAETLKVLDPDGAVAEAVRLARLAPAPDDVTVFVIRRDR
ncbi:PP2C family protein-serine/threonine phosphatase [Tessaracoccus oleiagri]|uniref:Serine phosphatase RsbU, regulator of sigma subunit n=1 Tax=Tessaracoccus oleiagri TaxID=686624 RepID=A0A1G9JYD4_9ACTN|nr:GAF domain-containing SpoIIE family protein phosphatase [Tessaracoccus oleiagri]SDL42531.1 Serine phosphatase RsbU, regulator of sigma subunit [Tessaracoccus oleiagri]